jgi:hypothetical protein
LPPDGLLPKFLQVVCLNGPTTACSCAAGRLEAGQWGVVHYVGMPGEPRKRRKKLPESVEAQILTECRRRCCLCQYLDNKTTPVVQGQIAHIDHDRSNNKPDNLAYLCMLHHDTYDSTTSQSKGITAAEVIHAKNSLIDYLRSDIASTNDVISLTLTLDASIQSRTDSEREHLIASLLPQLVEASRHRIEGIQGRSNFTVQLRVEDAERICQQYNARELPKEVVGVSITKPRPSKIAFSERYRDDKPGVSKQQAQEIISGHDQAMLFLGKEVVSSSGLASAGIFTKRFNKGGDRHTVIVITSVDSESTMTIYAALRAYHDVVGNLDNANPLQCLEAFLRVFGISIVMPGIPRASYVLGEVVNVPPSVSTRDEVYKYLMQFVEARDASYGVVGALSYVCPPHVIVHLLFVFDRKRYLATIGKR